MPKDFSQRSVHTHGHLRCKCARSRQNVCAYALCAHAYTWIFLKFFYYLMNLCFRFHKYRRYRHNNMDVCLLIFNAFYIFSKFEHESSPKLWTIQKLFETFEDTISKWTNVIRRNRPFPAPSLYSSPSIELKVLVHYYWTPCTI